MHIPSATEIPTTTGRSSGGGGGILVISAIVAALGSLLFGFDTAVISGTTDALRQVFKEHSLGTSTALGGSYLWHEWLFLARSYPGFIPRHAFLTLVKGMAVLAAHVADVLPKRWVRCMSMQPAFWDHR